MQRSEATNGTQEPFEKYRQLSVVSSEPNMLRQDLTLNAVLYTLYAHSSELKPGAYEVFVCVRPVLGASADWTLAALSIRSTM